MFIQALVPSSNLQFFSTNNTKTKSIRNNTASKKQGGRRVLIEADNLVISK